MSPHSDPKYLAVLSDVIEGMKEYHPDLLADEDVVMRVTERSAQFYHDTGNAQADYQHLRDSVENVIDDIRTQDDWYDPYDYATFVRQVEQHETSSLVSIDRNEVNGFVTIRFSDNAGHLAGKLTFDEVDEEMIGRIKAVTDHLAASENTIIYQDEVDEVWEAYDPDQTSSIKI